MAGIKKNYPLRMQPEMLDAIQKWADDEFRSLNGQIEYLLAKALKDAGRMPKPKGNKES
jgi:hypothetical protein